MEHMGKKTNIVIKGRRDYLPRCRSRTVSLREALGTNTATKEYFCREMEVFERFPPDSIQVFHML